MLKDFSPWQKLQFSLILMIVLLWLICFICIFCGYAIPDDAQPYLMVFWSIILIFVDPKALAKIVANISNINPTTKEKVNEKIHEVVPETISSTESDCTESREH